MQRKCLIEKDGKEQEVFTDIYDAAPESEAAIFNAVPLRFPSDLYNGDGFSLLWVEGEPKMLFVNNVLLPGCGPR